MCYNVVMNKYLLILLVLSGCAPWGMSHEPKLATSPKDLVKYESDLKFCREDMLRRFKVAEAAHKDDKLTPALGLVGYVIAQSNAAPDDDYYKSQGQVIDECIAKRGYAVII